jgi:magnesium-transporting ATPase (P-type)
LNSSYTKDCNFFFAGVETFKLVKTPENIDVIRDGHCQEVNAEYLVPGDICSVKFGDKVPADLRIIKSLDLKVNNANLTGEDKDIVLGTESLHQNIEEAKNIAMMGCQITSGNGLGIVFATGELTLSEKFLPIRMLKKLTVF